MKKTRKIIHLALVGLLLNAPIQMSWAQGGAGSATERITGSSFGSLPAPTLSPGPGSGLGQGMVAPIASYAGPSYQIHVLGAVGKPDTYRVPASTRLSEALQAAGGVDGQGSSRRIELRRKGQKTKVLDMLAFRQYADLSQNPYLLDNDVIFVPLQGKVVRIAGAVKRAGTYELIRTTSLAGLIALAGGPTPGADRKGPIKVVRHRSGQKELLDVPQEREALKTFTLRNGDVAIVHHLLTQDKRFDYNLAELPGDNTLFFPSYDERVFILGAVAGPGPYPYSPYYHVREYLTLAGGLTKAAKASRKIKLMTALGKVSRARPETMVSPGDTIIIPERYMQPENWATLILGITSAALGVTATVLTLSR